MARKLERLLCECGDLSLDTQIHAKLDVAVHVLHTVRREADSGSLWVRPPGGQSTLHIRDCLKQDGSRGHQDRLTTRHSSWHMHAHIHMNTDTQTSGKQRTFVSH